MDCQDRPPRIVLVIWMVAIIAVGAVAGIVIGARSGPMAGLLWVTVIWVILGGVEVTYLLFHEENRV